MFIENGNDKNHYKFETFPYPIYTEQNDAKFCYVPV